MPIDHSSMAWSWVKGRWKQEDLRSGDARRGVAIRLRRLKAWNAAGARECAAKRVIHLGRNPRPVGGGRATRSESW
jgi:hypothetical protein